MQRCGFQKLVCATISHMFFNNQLICLCEDELLDEKESAERLIGFQGATGAGKTSLINALLGLEGLLPSSSENSSTATITKISTLRNAAPEICFRAKIEFIELSEFKADLDRFYGDVAAENKEEDSDNDDSEDEDEPGMAAAERTARVRHWLKKLNAIYPLMDDDEIKASTAEEMIADEAVQQVLTGGPLVFEDANLEAFSHNLKPYVDSSLKKNSVGRHMSVWPLVRIVNLYTNAAILDHEVVLVDLPGSNNDSNEARSAIAGNFKDQLLITAIVAPAERAISDKGASLLCSKHEELRLMMDRKFKPSRLCFVMSQIDDMPVEEFIREHPDIEKDMEGIIAMETKLTEQILTYKAHDSSKKRMHEDSIDNVSAAEESLPDQKRARKDVKGSGN